MERLTMREILLEKTFKPSLAVPRKVRDVLNKVMERYGINATLRNNFLLAASEIIVNLVHHSQPPSVRSTIMFGCSKENWILDVFDDGGEFVSFADHLKPTLPEPLAEGGMGLRMIASIFDNLQYTQGSLWADGRNRFRVCAPRVECKPTLPRVMLVDDDPSIRQIMELYLRHEFDVVSCESAVEAAEVLQHQDIDLVVSDICMPGVSGIDLRREMGKNSRTDTIPFIFVTARKDRQTQDEAEGLTIDDYLLKPVSKERLLAVTHRVLNRARYIRQRLGNRLDDAITDALHPTLPPELGAYKTVVRWRNATAGGGDLLYHREQQNGDLVVLTDLMGHGEEAKFFSHVVAGYLHGILGSSCEDKSPALVLDRLSSALGSDRVLNGTIATSLAVLLEDHGRVRIASGGHPAPFVVHDGETTPFDVGGPLPGLVPDHNYEERVLTLGKGDRLILFTDGMMEVGSSPRQRHHSEQMITKAIRASAKMPAEAAADHIIEVLDGLCGNEPGDDATLVLLESSA